MIIKALMISTLLTNDPTIVAIPPVKIELQARKRSGKGSRGKRRGGWGLR